MGNPASTLKTNIDNQVTNKTQPYSIDHTEVGNLLKSIVDLTLPLQFNSTSLRLAYLTNPNAQPFQLCDDKEDGNKYYINKDGTAWVLLATGNAPKFEVISFTNQPSMIISWNQARRDKFGAAPEFIIETLDSDGVYRRKYGLEIYPDNISNTLAYHIDLGGEGQSGRIIIR